MELTNIEKEKEFDSSEIKILVDDLKSDIIKTRESLIKNNKYKQVKKKPLYYTYQNSRFFSIVRKLKEVPILGKMLVVIKQKLFKGS